MKKTLQILSFLTATLLITNQVYAQCTDITPDGPFCVGDEITFMASCMNAATDWEYNDGNGMMTFSGPELTLTLTADITISVGDAGDGSTTHMETFVVNALPTIDAGGPYSDLCDNEAPILLTGLPTNSGGSWSGMGVIDNNDGTATFNPNNLDGTITVTYSYTDMTTGCTNTDATADIEVDPAPVLELEFNLFDGNNWQAGTMTTVCEGHDELRLRGNFPGSNGYEWTDPNGVIINSRTVILNDVTPNMAGIYEVIYTSNNSCSDTMEFDLTVNPLPDPMIDQAGPFCVADGNVTLTANPPGGSFSGNGILPNGLFSPSDAGVGMHIISYMFTDANSCTGTGTSTIEVTTGPNNTLIVDAPDACLDGIATVNIFDSENGVEYQLLVNGSPFGAPQVSNGEDPLVFSFDAPSTQTTYQVQATEGTCTVILDDTGIVSLFPVSTGVISLSNSPACVGGTGPQITFEGGVGPNPYMFTYSINGTPQSPISTSGGSSTATIDIPTTSDLNATYTLTQIEDDNGCIVDISGQSVNVIINDLPVIGAGGPYGPLCDNENAIVLTGSPENSGGSWSGSGVSDNGDGTALFNPSGLDGNISVTYSYTDPTTMCTNTPAATDIQVNVAPNITTGGTYGPICENDSPITLTGTPTNGGGSWTGMGVTDNGNGTASFNPSGLAGNINVTYNYTDPATMCTNPPASTMILVNDVPSASIMGNAEVCENDPEPIVTITANGGTGPYIYQYSINGTTVNSPMTGGTLNITQQTDIPDNLSLIHISEPTRPY